MKEKDKEKIINFIDKHPELVDCFLEMMEIAEDKRENLGMRRRNSYVKLYITVPLRLIPLLQKVGKILSVSVLYRPNSEVSSIPTSSGSTLS